MPSFSLNTSHLHMTVITMLLCSAFEINEAESWLCRKKDSVYFIKVWWQFLHLSDSRSTKSNEISIILYFIFITENVKHVHKFEEHCNKLPYIFTFCFNSYQLMVLSHLHAYPLSSPFPHFHPDLFWKQISDIISCLP